MDATAIVPPPLGDVDTDPAANRLAVNIRRELARQLRGAAIVLDASFRVRAGEVIYHPDVIVDAGGPDRGAQLAREPKAVFEVAGAGSERAAFIRKWSIHERLPTVDIHALVDPERMYVTLHRRDEDGRWREETLIGAEDCILLPQLCCSLTLETIYRDAISGGDEGRI